MGPSGWGQPLPLLFPRGRVLAASRRAARAPRSSPGAVSSYLASDGRQQGVEAGGQEDPPSEGIAEGDDFPGAMSLLVICLDYLDGEEGAGQHEDADAQQAQHFGHHDLHGAAWAGGGGLQQAKGEGEVLLEQSCGQEGNEGLPRVSACRGEEQLASQTPCRPLDLNSPPSQPGGGGWSGEEAQSSDAAGQRNRQGRELNCSKR